MNPSATGNPRVRIEKVEVLSDNWYVLRKVTFDFQRSDGSWQTLSREPTTAATAPPFCSTAAPSRR
ncbi:ribonuclease HI [Xanthomonas sp. JAI131]|nr:ribonuclease HI [Xanthomonas sp. JAI131]